MMRLRSGLALPLPLIPLGLTGIEHLVRRVMPTGRHAIGRFAWE